MSFWEDYREPVDQVRRQMADEFADSSELLSNDEITAIVDRIIVGYATECGLADLDSDEIAVIGENVVYEINEAEELAIAGAIDMPENNYHYDFA